MKKFLIGLFVCMLFSSISAIAEPVDVDFNDGIYHITVKGDKMKNELKFMHPKA